MFHKLPFSIATKMLVYPVVCNNAVLALHELCDCHPDILMADKNLRFDLELAKVHLPLLNLCVDNVGNTVVPAVARRILRVVNAAFHMQLVHSDHPVQFVTFLNLIIEIPYILKVEVRTP